MKSASWFLLLAALLVLDSARAAFPTVFCSRMNDATLMFEEGVDDFYLDVTQRPQTNTLLSQLMKKAEWINYVFTAKIPKVDAAMTKANCLVSLDKPFLFSCKQGAVSPRATLKVADNQHTSPGVVIAPPKDLQLTSLKVVSQVLTRKSLDHYGHVQKLEMTSFRINVTVKGQTEIQSSLEFQPGSCTYGEKESPARDL